MNKNSSRDVTIYFAHDLLGYTAPELARIYGIGAPRIRQIVQRVRRVDKGETTHGPTNVALRQMRQKYSYRTLESIKSLRNFARKLDSDICRFMSALIAYAPEIQSTPFLDGIYCVSDNLEEWLDELNAELEKFLRSGLVDQTEAP